MNGMAAEEVSWIRLCELRRTDSFSWLNNLVWCMLFTSLFKACKVNFSEWHQRYCFFLSLSHDCTCVVIFFFFFSFFWRRKGRILSFCDGCGYLKGYSACCASECHHHYLLCPCALPHFCFSLAWQQQNSALSHFKIKSQVSYILTDQQASAHPHFWFLKLSAYPI